MLKQRQGFTLIELLIVIVIIGILAAIAIPKFGATREKAYEKAMMSDLRNLSAQQELYYSDLVNNYTYAPAEQVVPGTPSANMPDFATSAGVTVDINAPTTTGWSATATHTATDVECAIVVGDEDLLPVGAADALGVVACAAPAAAPVP